MEWVRFALVAFFLALALFAFASAVLGANHFGFIMNRIHASGVGDTLALGCTALAVMIGTGEVAVILKLLLIMVFMWCTSPVTTHFLGQIEYHMNRELDDYARREDRHDDTGSL